MDCRYLASDLSRNIKLMNEHSLRGVGSLNQFDLMDTKLLQTI